MALLGGSRKINLNLSEWDCLPVRDAGVINTVHAVHTWFFGWENGRRKDDLTFKNGYI